MIVRKVLPFLAALILGIGSAVLVACGDGTKDGIPSDQASDLSSQFEDVQQAVADGRCDDVAGQRRQIDEQIDQLGSEVDSRLRERLRQASSNLRDTALRECNEGTQPEEEPETTETVPPETTETIPPETTTTPPEEQDPTTEPIPDDFPEEDPTLPPDDGTGVPQDQDTLPADPGGGTSPELFP